MVGGLRSDRCGDWPECEEEERQNEAQRYNVDREAVATK